MIRAKKVTSTEDLISKIKIDFKSWETTTYPWFRGEPADSKSPLLPKLYRPRIGKQPHSENRLLQQFRMKAPSLGMMNTPPRNHTDEWLFLAQHVGLPTRLLDWTEGLFVALYFALQEKKPTIWMLDPIELNRRASNNSIEDNEFSLTWFSLDKVPATKLDIAELSVYISLLDQLKETDKIDISKYIKEIEYLRMSNLGNINIRGAWEHDNCGTDLPVSIHPTNVHIRMNTQKSCFTIQGKRKECLSKLVDSRVLRKYIIPQEHINAFKNDLRLIGFTHTSVFPDLDNLAKELSEIF